MVPAGGGQGARGLWPGMWPPGMSVGWSSPRAARTTARCGRTFWRRSRPISPSAPSIGPVTADGADATRTCHTTIAGRGGTAIIPIRRSGRARKEDGPAARARNKTLRATRRFGRALWTRLTGYHARSRIEAKMLCLKSFGERIASRDPDRQTAGIHTRAALMTRFAALGRAEITRAAKHKKESGKPNLRSGCATMPASPRRSNRHGTWHVLPTRPSPRKGAGPTERQA